MTRFLFSFSFLLLSLVMGVRAQTIENFGYDFNEDTKEITIKYCSLKIEDISIPASAFINGEEYLVTTIKGIYNSGNNANTKRIFIPATVTKFTDPITSTSTTTKLKCVVIENGDFYVKNHLLSIGSIYLLNLDIIIIGSCAKNSAQICDKSDYLYKAGEIIITKTDKSTEPVQMYLFNGDSKNSYKFDDSILSNLLWALEKHGIDLNDIESINLSQMSQDGKTINFDNLTDFSAIPNAQVITHKTTINDMAENYTPQAFTGLITYSRSNTAGWNTVCLPFDVKESDFPTGTEIYLMSSDTEDAIYLSRIEEGTTLSAGTPCFIWSPKDAKEWNLSINGEITANIPAGITTLNHWSLQGSFETRVLGTGYYKLNSAGDAFVMTTSSSHTFPFRCYIAPTPSNSSAPARLGMGIDEEATITLVPDDRAPQQVKLYDLMGRPRQGNASGLFVPSKR